VYTALCHCLQTSTISHWILQSPHLWQYAEPILSAVCHSYCTAGSSLFKTCCQQILQFSKWWIFQALTFTREPATHLQHFLKLLQFTPTNEANFY